MNFYYLAFNYKGDVGVIKVSSTQLANETLGHTDDILDFKFEEENQVNESQCFSEKMFLYDNDYVVEFDSLDLHCVCLSECTIETHIDGSEEVYIGKIVASGIPWVCVKIEDENGKELYNLSTEI